MINQKGQTILEILLAFGVSVLVLTGVILGISTSLKKSEYAKDQSLASAYAQEGMATVRKTRDISWHNFTDTFTTNTKYCIKSDLSLSAPISAGQHCTGVTNGIGNPPGYIFSREVTVEHDCSAGACASAGCAGGSYVQLDVFWATGDCTSGSYCHKVGIVSCLFNLYDPPTPTP